MTNYEKGRRFEYKLMKMFKKQGALAVFRSAGSKGFADLIVLFENRVMFVQAKTGDAELFDDYSKMAKIALQIKSTPENPFYAAFRIIREKNGKIDYFDI